MKKSHVYAIVAGVATVAIVVGCVLCLVFMPLATPFVAVIGGAIVTWGVNAALNKLSENVVQIIPEPIPERNFPERNKDEMPHSHTVIFRRHESLDDLAGHHIINDTTETFTDDQKLSDKHPGLD